MNELLDWVEKAAVENLRAHHVAADVIAKESATTLTVLLAGMATALAYSAKAVEQDTWGWLPVGAAAFSAYLLALSLWLVVGCLKIDDLPAIYNEPSKLLNKAYSVEQLREYELENMQLRINQAVERNDRVAGRLNRIRIAAVLSPVIFVVTAAGWVAVAAA